LDEITIRVEVKDQDLCVEGGGTQALRERFRRSVYATTGVRARVQLAATGTLARSKGKANRVLDLRER
jgi:phenylacetate-CoA ligase